MRTEPLNLAVQPLTNWLASAREPLVIGGPCSAESEAQVIAAANALRQIPQVAAFRAGVWKPRTRPNSFEGRGEAALPWLQRVQRETGLRVAVEVARAEHVAACLEHGMDMLWIGARSVVNPFTVQEIADALSGVDIPVLVKNPIVPDISLWIGALERLNAVGIRKLAAVHRGFTGFVSTEMRYAPEWKIPIELKRICPDLPLLCDPSHIAGKESLLGPIAQEALNLDMNGLMLECHPEPQQALSDKQQQITPAELTALLSNLRVRHSQPGNGRFADHVASLRREIDQIDHELLEVLARRMEAVAKIGHYKDQFDVTPLQIQRWNEVIQSRLLEARQKSLDSGFIEELFQLLHGEAIRRQNTDLNGTNTANSHNNRAQDNDRIQ